MIDLLLGYDDIVGDWVAGRIKDVSSADDFLPFRAIGFGRDQQIVGGVVYYNFTGDDVFANIAIDDPKCLNKANLRSMFAYPFLDQKCNRITVYCAKGNKKARKLAQALGFKQEGVMRQAIGRKYDAIFYGMLKDECKWIKEKANGQEVSTETAEAA